MGPLHGLAMLGNKTSADGKQRHRDGRLQAHRFESLRGCILTSYLHGDTDKKDEKSPISTVDVLAEVPNGHHSNAEKVLPLHQRKSLTIHYIPGFSFEMTLFFFI